MIILNLSFGYLISIIIYKLLVFFNKFIERLEKIHSYFSNIEANIWCRVGFIIIGGNAKHWVPSLEKISEGEFPKRIQERAKTLLKEKNIDIRTEIPTITKTSSSSSHQNSSNFSYNIFSVFRDREDFNAAELTLKNTDDDDHFVKDRDLVRQQKIQRLIDDETDKTPFSHERHVLGERRIETWGR
ncbi:hypothetical protein F8M41_008647 [Gigaspora margarita]|uniref:Uncharacterized protein n=1 Tax=Gigaspora margarita TaxID=4874 RepID=A0A8H4EQV1_GIGMA|nr:hypothetical protein F8M41_008647 [Gigaspora margarita]